MCSRLHMASKGLIKGNAFDEEEDGMVNDGDDYDDGGDGAVVLVMVLCAYQPKG